MSSPISGRSRPPYLAALVVVILVLAGYAATVAPSVTWWDAGEFIAAMKELGIPHPPGTPLFVMLGHVWAALLPLGSYAVRTNLLSATCSAFAAGGFFLVVHASLGSVVSGLPEPTARRLRLGGAAAAAIIGAFTFTTWQNSNETEVYAAALLLIAATCWLAQVWRIKREEPRGPRILLLLVFLLGLSVANHLLALLAGPAIIFFLAYVLLREPAGDPLRRRAEWGQVAIIAGVWALLIGAGLGNTTLLSLGAVCFAIAFVVAALNGAALFGVAALLLAAVGITPFLFLYLRSAQHPYLNEAAPATWDALLAVIRRAQYPVRTPFDDPTVYHGAGNPGRSLTLIGLQLQEYLLYFNWQWAKGLATAIPIGRGGLAFPLRTLITLLFLFLGVRGTLLQRRTDRAGWWLLFVLWLITGLGLVAYMNFKPAFSLGYGQYPNPADHEVRDRDYFFLVSFAVWGFWAGIGLTGLVRDWLQSGRTRLRTGLGVLCVGALIPVALNWRAATRRGPDAMLPADVAYDLLNTAPPYGILVTYGDNDTFPLWWAQRVEGIRRDVTIVCLALGQTEWYMRQLRDLPTEPFDEAAAPPVWRGRHPTMPTWPLHTMSDEEIAAAVPQMISRNSSVQVGPVVATIPAGTVLDPNDFLMLRIVQQNAGRRPIVWSTTTGRQFSGLRRYVVQQGLGFRLVTTPTDSEPTPIAAPPLDEPLTHQLAWDTYRYSGLLDRESPDLEPSSAGFTRALAMPFTRLALAAEQRGDAAAVRANLERAVRLSPDPAIQAALDRYRFSSP